MKYNGPWNVATDFDIDMSFSAKEIETMLKEYEADYHTGMEVPSISRLLHDYTSGYPYLVSRICQVLDEKIVGGKAFETRAKVWRRREC